MNCIILTRNGDSPSASRLKKIVSQYCNVNVVVDPGKNIAGYQYMCSPGLCTDEKYTTAWDVAFIDIDTTDYCWFIEDDVAFCEHSFKTLLEITSSQTEDLLALNITSRDDSSDWYWWKHYDDVTGIDDMYVSFNPLCRLSSNLIQQILKYREKYGKFTFHEILFPSLAQTRFDLKDHSVLDFVHFAWRNDLPRYRKRTDCFYHPVKDDSMHSKFCKV